jgi:hypothetical protein
VTPAPDRVERRHVAMLRRREPCDTSSVNSAIARIGSPALQMAF